MNPESQRFFQAHAPLPGLQHKETARIWYEQLQHTICSGLEVLETQFITAKGLEKQPALFRRKTWDRPGGGGGTMAVLEGDVFEKAGVNVSTVWGTFSPEMRAQIPGAGDKGDFWASGISLVIHPKSPHVPIIHMNTRHIITACSWFGGGIDLTPALPQEDETQLFHGELKQVCDAHNLDYYPHFKAWADTYFYLPHRQEARGVGGIFYDYLNTGNWGADFAFNQAIGALFMPLYQRIVEPKLLLLYNEQEKEAQLRKRGRYVEFNLLYDRGTQFGLRTGGYTEAILMSMPPEAIWPALREDA